MRLFDNPLSKYHILKRISCMQWLFWLSTKIIKGFWTIFWSTFSAWFFYKNVPNLILNWQSFSVIPFFPSQDIKQNVLLNSYLDNWRHLNFKIYLWSSSKTMTDREKKVKVEIQKFEHLENEKSFLDEIKGIFHNYLRAIVWWKHEK